VVEYHPDEVDRFIALADALEEQFASLVVDGVEVEEQPQGFIVKTEDGRVLFSKDESGRFPDPDELAAAIAALGVRPR
jgi:selT/selW/selH-like putative selenoprotein